jgi:serine/threonine protein kinase
MMRILVLALLVQSFAIPTLAAKAATTASVRASTKFPFPSELEKDFKLETDLSPDSNQNHPNCVYLVSAKKAKIASGYTYWSEGQQLIIKVPRPSSQESKNPTLRALDEVQALQLLSRLITPLVGVVMYLASGTLSDFRQYAIYPYFSRGDLFDFLLALDDKKTRLAEWEALAYLHQIAMIVNDIHTHNFAHHDLKPENIFLAPPPPGSPEGTLFELRLHDFEFTQCCHARCWRGWNGGTKDFMSPEHSFLLDRREKGLGNVDPRASDIYSLGLIAFMLVSNEPLFESVGVYHRTQLRVKGLKYIQSRLKAKGTSEQTMLLIYEMLQEDWTRRLTIQRVLEKIESALGKLRPQTKLRKQMPATSCVPAATSIATSAATPTVASASSTAPALKPVGSCVPAPAPTQAPAPALAAQPSA